MKNKKKGFTLVELIVVLAILAILAAMLVPALTGYIDKANEKKIVATARQYYIAAQATVSDAYAANTQFSKIEILNDGSTKVTYKLDKGTASTAEKNSNTDKDPWAVSFKDLAEIKVKDTAKFDLTDANPTEILSGEVTSNGYKATLENGSWTVAKTNS